MQLIIAIPETLASQTRDAVESLLRPVCGMPLLTRVLATAVRAGIDNLLLIWPESVPPWIREQALSSHLLHNLPVIILSLNGEFEPSSTLSWKRVEQYVAPEFLWVPWNWVTVKQSLSELQAQSMSTADWNRPALVDFHSKTRIDDSRIAAHAPEGIAVVSSGTAREAERYLLRRAGKALDGIHTSFNRYLCRPAVRWLSHTGVTPNAVSIGGLLVAVLSSFAFMFGSYWFDVLGASFFFVAGLFDEMDGMLARIKFMDSPFGCWLEGSIDALSYLLLFGGMAIGLSRHHPRAGVWSGIALLLGAALSLIITMRQRKKGASADRPHEYLGNFYSLLERDSANAISRVVRTIQPFEKKGVMIHYLLIFAVCGGLSVFLYLAILGSNLTWVLALYFNRHFFRNQSKHSHLPITNSVES